MQDVVGKLNNAAGQIGNLELQKHRLNHAALEIQNDLQKLQNKLEEKYGKVQINIQDGTISSVEEGVEEVETEEVK